METYKESVRQFNHLKADCVGAYEELIYVIETIYLMNDCMKSSPIVFNRRATVTGSSATEQPVPV
ncbi:hypothetical protein [Spirosoma utsteinense]|uniref:Uncharacterized protein n=1 Tax=Spirosoma utsteinense TaxID=2585773 RepID=A0ABR6WAU0_9BACT|nr:hypothetical protein [Spirosoma utsteinense]MBC3787019.1 hypothetical protein [Spirosoma utsteinense]MBC3793399.1 hypothetical protein [Spirosoma utsteinense]